MAGDREDRTIPDTPSARGHDRDRAVPIPARYRLGEVLGEGGMGRVYRAHDATLGRDVAVKVLELELRGEDRVVPCERFVREARTAARLVHPNIVAVHDVDPDAGWLVMALVEGMSLRDLPPPLSVELVEAVARQLLSALCAAHAAGVVHRDIKPSNIIVNLENRHATLIDFGVARLLDGELTQTGERLGTPAYMAPEQVRGAAIDGLGICTASARRCTSSPSATCIVAFGSRASARSRGHAACSAPGLARRSGAACRRIARPAPRRPPPRRGVDERRPRTRRATPPPPPPPPGAIATPALLRGCKRIWDRGVCPARRRRAGAGRSWRSRR
ncbi:MAG: serine/threonine protein kinase [Deltaproteobacteria bacterium]|nr:serine/threonine protein kinase [Deltaproteobacteria bacterium]